MITDWLCGALTAPVTVKSILPDVHQDWIVSVRKMSNVTVTGDPAHSTRSRNLMPNTHRWRRRDATVELSRVGVGGVYIIRN